MGEPYDWADNNDHDPDDCRARMLAVFVFVAIGSLSAGLALGWILDLIHP